MLKSMVEIMVSCTKSVMTDFNEKLKNSKDPFIREEMVAVFNQLSLDIILYSAFGNSISSDKKKFIAESFSSIVSIGMSRTVGVIGIIPYLNKIPSPSSYKRNVYIKRLHELVQNIIQDRRTGKSKSMCSGKDLLDLLLETKDEQGIGLKSDMISNNIMTFIFAGHETTSMLLSWCFYILSSHPEAVDKCREEAARVFGTEDPNADSLKQLNYVEAVLLETLRMFPPAPVIVRMAIGDHTIGSGKKELKILKGTIIRTMIYYIQRDPTHWENPETFNPDRFINSKRSQNSFTFIPFGMGKRNCIGQNLAMMEAKVALALLAQNFSWKLSEGQKIAYDVMITLKPKYGINVDIQHAPATTNN